MSDQPALLSEEDIRTKVVYTWLVDHGFTPESILVEFSFEIRLGRGIYSVSNNSPHSPTFRPRADILVRSSDGRNLLIIEVKAPDEELDNDAKEQGISYARLLKTGGIAPFVIVTNGFQTQIFDSITEESIEDSYISKNHQYVQNGFRVCVDDIALRSEALRKFIALSFDNLLAFCNSQASHRMSLLKSEDLFSGNKYIPQLYIERQEEKRYLKQLLLRQNCSSVIVFGHPQVGKTNFICNFIEERLKNGYPCLFYPAIGMRKGVLEEIRDDFGWDLYEPNSHHEMIKYISHILEKNQQRLVIFIDGWNEANESIAKSIDLDSLRIFDYNFQIVISITANSTKRLLIDNAGNPSNIADSSFLTSNSIPLLESNPNLLSSKCSVLEIKKYGRREAEEAYRVYSQAYEVRIPNGHEQVDDPFLLRIAMEHHTELELPERLDEDSLQERSIVSKIRRAKGISEEDAIVLLTELAKEMAENGSPISQTRIREIWRISAADKIPEGFFESALLAKVRDIDGFPSLDFYYERERSFIISTWVMGWRRSSPAAFRDSWANASISNSSLVKLEALDWFLRQKSSISYLKELAANINFFQEKNFRKKVLSAIRQNPECWINENENWVDEVAETAILDSKLEVRVEAAKLFLLFKEDSDRLRSIFIDEECREEFIRALLETDSEYCFKIGDIGQVTLEVLSEVHFEFGVGDSSEVTDILKRILLIEHGSLRNSAAKVFGHIAPESFFRVLLQLIKFPSLKQVSTEDFIEGVELAFDALMDIYHGDMCPGYLQSFEDAPREHVEHFLEIRKICIPIINFYSPKSCSHNLLDFLKSISPSDRVLAFYTDEKDEIDNEVWLSKFKHQDPGITQLNLFENAINEDDLNLNGF
ncbi:type I restriction enzyme HsdR N-terminal domain-containing protein [Nodosilinea sp. FACHB-131]|uniref:type I restriction enzyme HsdR N-terminal domain-containing protein n=1 Tax=Cyanophyceae TaxID=3028117 RepID=UPI001683E2D4|nr:type I restriction enzyme HsdR N-terminal domain-containing protein [Nodosilinea sp. FACHB-131]MBD1876733.1 type I restriction enzyme HsdR N-terminal domain-containing protein [Nodosilinea sp. FACHB-131]